MIKACIFDMDGVIVDSARYHFFSWKRLAESLGFTLTEQDNEQLKGVSRMASLEIILKIGGITKTEAEKEELCAQKNAWFVEYINQMTPSEILPGVLSFFADLKKNNIKIALGSASKNAQLILSKIGMSEMFDAVVDGTKVSKAKPDPEVFLVGASMLNENPENCVVFEDAAAGIEAACRGKMMCVGVGSSSVLGKANFCINSFAELNFEILKSKME